MEGRGVAGHKSTARDLGAYICFEDEAGQGLRPPKGRTWAPRGARPVVSVRGAGGGRVSIAGVVCYRPGDRPRLFYVGYTAEGTSKLMRRHGWSAQVPVRQAMERDEGAVAVWKAEVWPEIKGWRGTWAPTSASRMRQAGG